MSIYEEILDLIKSDSYDKAKLNDIANRMEEKIGPAEMWNTLRPGLDYEEFIENLEYIAREADI